MRTLFFNSITRFILVCIGSFLWRSALADDNDNTIKIPDFPYKSPEALSFERYGEYNVGEYSGNAQIAIPLYNIKCRDIEIPLTLTYQGNGIKVAEEASWVGLGWNLAIGGCITRVSSGGTDLLARVGSWNEMKAYINGAPADYYKTDNYSRSMSQSLIEDCNHGIGEIDFYSANILGTFFYFFINPDNESAQIIGMDVDKFQISQTGGGWCITDAYGYKYSFYNEEIGMSETGAQYTTAWNITEIESPIHSHVYFTYTNPSYIKYHPQLYQQYDYVIHNEPLRVSSTPSPQYQGGFTSYLTLADIEMYKSFLTQITTDEHIITFNLGYRADIATPTAKRLDSLNIISRLTNKVVKKIKFNYEYLNSNTIGGNYLIENLYVPTMTDDCSKRLKLSSLSDITDNNDIKVHSFEYEEEYGLPCKASYATDMWGYYNGQENIGPQYGTFTTHTFIPSTRLTALGTSSIDNFIPSLRYFEAANRLCSAKYINQYCLKKITYPTKGYTLFHFEPHTYINSIAYPDAESSFVKKKEYNCQDINYSGINSGPNVVTTFILDHIFKGVLKAIFTANHSTGNSIYNMKEKSASVTLIQLGVSSPSIYQMDLSEVTGNLNTIYSYTLEKDVILPVGTYKMVANLPDAFGENPNMSVRGTLTGTHHIAEANQITSIGGGLRIKSIENYDSDNTLQEKITYEYLTDDGISSGILLSPMKLATNKEIYSFYGMDISLIDLYRFQSSPLSSPIITQCLNNTNVGYSRVVKKVNGRNKGIIISVFSNQAPNEIFPNMFFYSEPCHNGNLLQQIIIDANNDTLKRVDNVYVDNTTKFKYNMKIEDIVIGSPGDSQLLLQNQMLGRGRYNAYIYYFPLTWNRLQSSQITHYSHGVRTLSKNYQYDYSNKNHCISAINEKSSVENIEYVTRYEYPNSTDGIEVNMQNANMLNTLISESKFIKADDEETLIKKEKTNYWGFYNNLYILPYSTNISLTGTTEETRINKTYDIYGNIQEISKDHTENVVYLWGYNSLYPVVKIEGATYNNVLGYLTEAEIESLANNTTSVPAALAIIRSKLANSNFLVTTYTYDSLVGMTSQTLPNGQTTTYLYDTAGRLSQVLDNDGNILQKYTYHYQP